MDAEHSVEIIISVEIGSSSGALQGWERPGLVIKVFSSASALRLLLWSKLSLQFASIESVRGWAQYDRR